MALVVGVGVDLVDMVAAVDMVVEAAGLVDMAEATGVAMAEEEVVMVAMRETDGAAVEEVSSNDHYSVFQPSALAYRLAFNSYSLLSVLIIPPYVV